MGEAMIIESNMLDQEFVNKLNGQERLLAEVQEIIKKDTNLQIEWSNTTYNNELEGMKNTTETYSNYGISLENALNIQLATNPMVSKNGRWSSATLNDVKAYCIPNRYNINNYKYQFLNLSQSADVPLDIMRSYLANKGILSGKEEIFMQAAKQYNLNEVYLIAHSLLETGNGTSELAQGVTYKGTIVYNMYGIKAVDSNPLGEGAAFAYKMGWITPEKAIEGGAKYISEQYVNHNIYAQNTLYEMRWNPASPGTHQYATDVAWAAKQAKRIEEIYGAFEKTTKTFDIPVYR